MSEDRFKEDVWEARQGLEERGFAVGYPLETTDEAEAFIVSRLGRRLLVRITRMEDRRPVGASHTRHP